MRTRSLANDTFEHPRLKERMRVSTIAFDEPVSYDIPACPEASYEFETIIFTGPPGDEHVRECLRYEREDRALAEHARIVERSLGHRSTEG